MSAINSINSNYGFTETTSTRNTGEMGKDDFLRLFIEQLKAQDPLSPMDNNQFIAQSAQFTQLEQMTNLNTNITKFLEQQTLLNNSVLYSQTSTQALNLVGKKITAFVSDKNGAFEKVEGIVDKVSFNGSYQTLHIGDKQVFLEEVADVSVVRESEAASDEE